MTADRGLVGQIAESFGLSTGRTVTETFAGWEKDSLGNIRAVPTAAWAIAVVPANVLLRLDLLDQSGELRPFQVQMSALGARDLAKDLMAAAAQALGDEPSRLS